MAYSSIAEMVQSPSLSQRITGAVAVEGEASPDAWTRDHIWAVVSSPGWAEAWDYARDNQTDDDNPDTGARPGVISDQMILSGVQAVRAVP